MYLEHNFRFQDLVQIIFFEFAISLGFLHRHLINFYNSLWIAPKSEFSPSE